MQKSLRSSDYARLLGLLIEARETADIRQRTLADKLGRPQSFVAKYEGGERRLDVLEFIAIAGALGKDPVRLLKNFVDGKSAKPKVLKKQSR